MTTDQLRKAEAQYASALHTYETLRKRRNKLVREALNAGWTHAQISEATGLSRSRIGQIALTKGA